MPEFVVRVGTASGEVRMDTFVAESEDSLRRDLERKDLYVFEVRKRGVSAGLLPTRRFGRPQISKQQFLIFNQQLVTLIRAGLPLVQCIEILLERLPDSPFRKALTDIRDRVRSGESLSEAFAAQGDLFPRIYSSSLTAGEKSGELDTVIERFVGYERRIAAVRRRVVSALVYPSILLVISSIVVGILTFYVLPKFVGLYSDFGKELPYYTQTIVGAAEFIRSRWFVVLGAVVGAVVGVRVWGSSEAGRASLERAKLRFPVLGAVWQKYLITQVSRTLSTLLAGGIPLVTALQVTSQSQSSTVASSRLARAAQEVREGNSLWSSMERTGFMTNLAVEMIKVGEATGALDAMLTNVADFYDQEIDQKLSTLLTIFEPVILLIMGIIIASLLLAMYLPIFATVQL